MTATLPALPYAGTAGYSGPSTSEEAARHEAETGKVKARQREVLRILAHRGADGLVVSELCTATGWHHGKASSALSTLHKDGHVARLAAPEDRRKRSAPYVLPQHVNDRLTAPHGRQRPEDPLRALVRSWVQPGEDGWSPAGRDPRGFTEALREALDEVT